MIRRTRLLALHQTSGVGFGRSSARDGRTRRNASALRKNRRILFVGTKRQAADPIAEAAKRCGQYYINQRWLGGLLTNWNTIQVSIKTLRKLEEQLGQPNIGFTKKELLSMSRQRDKLESSLGGIKDMGGRPDLIFIIDTNKEELAVKEAQNWAFPLSPLSTATARPTALAILFPAMTTQPALSASIAA